MMMESTGEQAPYQNGSERIVIKYVPERHLIVASVSGVLTNQIRADVVARAAELAAVHKCDRLLCDYRDTQFAESTVGIYQSPQVTGLLGPVGPRFQVAVLFSRDAGDHQFWETVMVNRGILARVFQVEQDALDWFGVAP